jgi:hypothetical protein
MSASQAERRGFESHRPLMDSLVAEFPDLNKAEWVEIVPERFPEKDRKGLQVGRCTLYSGKL